MGKELQGKKWRWPLETGEDKEMDCPQSLQKSPTLLIPAFHSWKMINVCQDKPLSLLQQQQEANALSNRKKTRRDYNWGSELISRRVRQVN